MEVEIFLCYNLTWFERDGFMNKPVLSEAKKRNRVTEFIEVDPILSNQYDGKKYYIRTYGCQMNVHDSEEIAGILENLGFVETDSEETADIVILNTCAVRENAHDKVFGFLGRCKHEKETNNPNLIICICQKLKFFMK